MRRPAPTRPARATPVARPGPAADEAPPRAPPPHRPQPSAARQEPAVAAPEPAADEASEEDLWALPPLPPEPIEPPRVPGIRAARAEEFRAKGKDRGFRPGPEDDWRHRPEAEPEERGPLVPDPAFPSGGTYHPEGWSEQRQLDAHDEAHERQEH